MPHVMADACLMWQSYISKGIWRQGIGSFVSKSYVSTLCPVVICPHLCTSDCDLTNTLEWSWAKKCRVGLGSIDPISTWFGIWVSILLWYSGHQTHAGPSFLLRERTGFDRFDSVSVLIWTPPFGDWSTAWNVTASFQQFDLEKWAQRLGDLNFQRACRSQ